MPSYQRTGRRLAGNRSSQLPRYLIAFDAETLPRQTDNRGRKFSHRFRLATATVGRMVGTEVTAVKRYRFTSVAEWWLWLKSVTACNYTTWMISHNALFDLVVCGFMDKFEKGELVVDWPRRKRVASEDKGQNKSNPCNSVIESPPTIIAARITDNQARIVILDTLNWFPVPLKQMGERCGLPKFNMPDFSASDEEWFTYCQRDSDILFHTFTELIKWVKDNDFGMFRYTAPGQAMAAYRHRFMSIPIFVHDNKEVKRLERSAYFGGRTEVFRKGEFNEIVYLLDINSLFPSVMLGGRFPHILDRYEIRKELTTELPNIDWINSVASVRVTTSKPIFPVRTHSCVIYPTGTFKTALCGMELDYAYSHGYIDSVGSWSEYRTAPIFTKWISELYKLRLRHKAAGDSLYSDFTKRLLNSLYGKWGERSPKWTNVDRNFAGTPWSSWIEIDSKTGKSTAYRMFGWQCQERVEPTETNKSFVAISAFVTASARMRMNYLRTIAGKENVYYQGVDGLIVSQTGRNKLDDVGELDESELGKLRLIKVTNNGEIIACADYRLGDKVIVGGRARRVEELADGSVLQRKFYAASALFNGQPLTEITEELQEWKRSTLVRKGCVGEGGWIEPFDLTEVD